MKDIVKKALSLSLIVGCVSLSTPAFAKTSIVKNNPQQLALDKRSGKSLRDFRVDPAKAALLSTLFPGLGQFYTGNDTTRSTWVAVGGAGLLVGGLWGLNTLSNRPPEAASLGNNIIILTLLAYHAWNIRDAYVQAESYNKALEHRNLITYSTQPQPIAFPLVSYHIAF